MRRRTGTTWAVLFVIGCLFVPMFTAAWLFQIFVNGLHKWWEFIPFMTYGDSFGIMVPLTVASYVLAALGLVLNRR